MLYNKTHRLQFGTLLMIPVCNMAAYATAIRNSPVDGLNLARVFPGSETGTLTQRIASLAAARVFGAPVLWGHPPPMPPGRTISAAIDLGVPCLYTEAAGAGPPARKT